MEHSKILDLLDKSPNTLPVTPPNTEVYPIMEQAELMIPPLLLNGKMPTLEDLQKMNQVVSFSGTEMSTSPSFSSSPKFSSDNKCEENMMDDYKTEMRNLKYKLICLDMKKREIEEENLKLHDDLEAQHYDINKLKKELTKMKNENVQLKNDLNKLSLNKLSNNGLIITIFGFTTATCAMIIKYYRNQI